MAHVIIGHTTGTSACVWVRGDKRLTTCAVDTSPANDRRPQRIRLTASTDYTDVLTFEHLLPNTDYTVRAVFGDVSQVTVLGHFHTLAEHPHGAAREFSFLLSSCNLTVVSISNGLAYLLSMAGTLAALSSLKTPPERWRYVPFVWLRRLIRPVVSLSINLTALCVDRLTGVKQPSPPFLRSPFLKLAAVFEPLLIDARILEEEKLPRVGDFVVADGACGVLASSPTFYRLASDAETGPRRTQLVLTQVTGSFLPGMQLRRRSRTTAEDVGTTFGVSSCVSKGKPWYDPPKFMIHAGDQIYFDIPRPTRSPNRNEYRLAYREAWFDDPDARHALAQWSNYMTLDDHEFADQFALDFEPPLKDVLPRTYLREGSVAYREYVTSRQPVDRDRMEGPFDYSFDKGGAHFFVLDTRTQRRCAKMIDRHQLERLKRWMCDHRSDLKFVVTSVPFVAEVNDAMNDERLRWIQQARAGQVSSAETPDSEGPKENASNDKWNARRFRKQRGEIIEHIEKERIERLVFLTGDMHCCYHASMRIGTGSKFETITIHELAGGPINQLQLARSVDFHPCRSGATKGGVRYEVVLDRFHGDVSAVMHIKVSHRPHEPTVHSEDSLMPEVEWNVIRTVTDTGTAAWSAGERSAGEPVMGGHISFVTKRTTKELIPWT